MLFVPVNLEQMRCALENANRLIMDPALMRPRLYGYSTFLPTIIKGLGKWTTAQVQALTIPCYCLGAVSYIMVARLSDSQQRRGLYTVVFGAVSVVGYGVLISNSSNGVRFLGCFLVALGLYVVVGLPLAWLPANNPRYGKRTTATGLQLTIGNASGIMSPFCRCSSWNRNLVDAYHTYLSIQDWRRTSFRQRPFYHTQSGWLRKFDLRFVVVVPGSRKQEKA